MITAVTIREWVLGRAMRIGQFLVPSIRIQKM